MNLAELNVGYARYPLDDPRMAGFMDNLDRINALAERSPGFVWRMQSAGGNATDIAVPGDPDMISNLSVWRDVESLGAYVFNTVHGRFYGRREDWFEPMAEPHFVMWHVPEGHEPTLDEAMDRLRHLRAHGATDHAFGWDAVEVGVGAGAGAGAGAWRKGRIRVCTGGAQGVHRGCPPNGART